MIQMMNNNHQNNLMNMCEFFIHRSHLEAVFINHISDFFSYA